MTAVVDAAALVGAAGPTYVDRSTSVWPRPGEPGTYDGVVGERWAGMRGVHGGMLAAMAVRAVEAEAPGRAVRTVSTSFLRPGTVGPIEARVQVERSGRAVTTASVELHQVHRRVALVRVTATGEVTSDDWDTAPPLDLPPLSECVPLNPPTGVRHFEHAEAVLDPADVPFSESAAARVGGWVRPREPSQRIGPAWLTMIMDWFPPSPFTRHAMPVGGVSVDYTVHLHTGAVALEGGDWLGARFVSDRGAGGLALEHGRLHAPDGSLVAESFHTRWTGS